MNIWFKKLKIKTKEALYFLSLVAYLHPLDFEPNPILSTNAVKIEINLSIPHHIWFDVMIVRKSDTLEVLSWEIEPHNKKITKKIL